MRSVTTATLFLAFAANVDCAKVMCDTTRGGIIIEVHKDWSPLGVERFLELVTKEWFDESPFFRSVEGFLMQFGISPYERRRHYWHKKGTIKDDPKVGRPVKKYTVSYAGGGKDSRDTQLWIALNDAKSGLASAGLGKESWETPIGEVVEGTDVIDALYKGYGDMPPWGKGPDPGKIEAPGGQQYLIKNFPKLDYFKHCAVMDNKQKWNRAKLRGASERHAIVGDK